MKFIKYKFNDATVLEEWSEILDGKWPFGDLDEKLVIKDCNFFPSEPKSN